LAGFSPTTYGHQDVFVHESEQEKAHQIIVTTLASLKL
jgi:cold shock CspA family protein